MQSGQRLRELRLARKMTQAQLARELGVTEFTVCRYENGQIGMPTEAIKRAAALFDACPAYFLADAGCTFGRDRELVEIFRRADRLPDGPRAVIKRTLSALLDSLPDKQGGDGGTDAQG